MIITRPFVRLLNSANTRFVILPFQARDPKAIEVVQVILETILLRREKTMLDSDGKPIVDLPGKEVGSLVLG